MNINIKIDQFYKQANSNLDHLLKNAILGSSEDWLVFLDLLEEVKPSILNHLVQRFKQSGLLGLFDVLYENFPEIIVSRDFHFLNPKLLGKVELLSPTGQKNDSDFNRMEYLTFDCGKGDSFAFVNLKTTTKLQGETYGDLFILINSSSGDIEEVSSSFDGPIRDYNRDEIFEIFENYFKIALKDFEQIKNLFKV
jgi:hypothetical protein